MNYYSQELYHHGIKGMKWGVRRYQNPDGTLTAEGRARYLNSNDSDRIYKDLRKAIRNKRAVENGKANRWMSGTPIGPNSKKLFEENKKKRDEYYNSKEFKNWNDRVEKADKLNQKLVESGKISMKEYDARWTKMMSERPKKKFNDVREGGYVYTSTGRKYINNFHKKGGFDVSVAYLQDLGYTPDESKIIINQILKKNYSFGMD